MTAIEPTRRNIAQPNQVKKHSRGLRFWHWANAIVITGSLVTVLVNATLNDRATATPVIQNELTKSGVTITAQQAGGIVHGLEDKVWEVHIYFGYALAALLLFRLVAEYFQLADQKFIRTFQAALRQFKVTKKNRELARHELVVKTLYAMFYLLLTTIALTGLFLAFEDLLAPLKSIRHSVKEIHGFCMYLMLAFITVHLVGVFLAERGDSKGIVSDMINGGTKE